jgi:hypothetical protein
MKRNKTKIKAGLTLMDLTEPVFFTQNFRAVSKKNEDTKVMFSTSILQTHHLNNVRLLIKNLFPEYPLFQRKENISVCMVCMF